MKVECTRPRVSSEQIFLARDFKSGQALLPKKLEEKMYIFQSRLGSGITSKVLNP